MSAVSLSSPTMLGATGFGEALLDELHREPGRAKGQDKASILLVEDDRSVNDLLALRFRLQGYRVLQAFNGLSGLEMYANLHPDLVLLDLILPELDGWQVLKQLREHSSTPVLMMTGRNQERDELRGLSLGADDYVLKPFSFSKLLARVEALIRRSRYVIDEDARSYEDSVLSLDLARRQVCVRGEGIELSPTEYRLLVTLVQGHGRALSHEELLQEVWGPNYDSTDCLKVSVASLRRKIEADPHEPSLIHTCWGIGYRYEALEERSPSAA